MSGGRRPAGVSTRRALTGAVVAVALLSTVARLLWLGARTFHWDEARVGYWTLRYLATGAFEYRPVAGGPLLYVLDRHLFALLGVSDATARLPVALIGGALPLAALLFRGRLRRSETAVLAVLLGGSPLFLYYSRFLRGDVPLAAFALAALGCAVRYRDGGGAGYLYGGAAALALAVASSGFVAGYLLCWLFAAALLFDHRRLLGAPARAADGGRGDGPAADRGPAARGPRRWWRWLRGEAGTLARAAGVYAAVHLLFFAPRAGDAGGPGLWELETFPAVVWAAFPGAVRAFLGVRVVTRGTGNEGHPLLPYLAHHAELLAVTAAPLVVLGAGAAVADRYGGGPPRRLVAFCAYWAGAALLVFPVATEVRAPWVALHVALPLTVPAAVGGGWLLRAGADAFRRGAAGTALAVLLLLVAAVAGTGAVAATAYEPPAPHQRLADDAQPGSDLDPFVADVAAAIAGNRGTDVLFYGDELTVGEAAGPNRPPVDADWGNRLPLSWYLERLGAATDDAPTDAGLADPPPVVVASQRHRADLDGRLGDGYRVSSYDLSLWDRTVVVFVRS